MPCLGAAEAIFWARAHSSAEGEKTAKLMVATCQFELSVNIRKNARIISDMIAEAAAKGADIIHFG